MKKFILIVGEWADQGIYSFDTMKQAEEYVKYHSIECYILALKYKEVLNG